MEPAGRGPPHCARPTLTVQHYIIHIGEAGGEEPLVLSVTVRSDARALEVARDWLAR